jgi:hypothetical protein
VLPGGVTLGLNDLVVLEERDYRSGRGVVRLQIAHVGDRDGNVPVGADWVTLIGHEVRREALRCIPSAAGRDLEGGS